MNSQFTIQFPHLINLYWLSLSLTLIQCVKRMLRSINCDRWGNCEESHPSSWQLAYERRSGNIWSREWLTMSKNKNHGVKKKSSSWLKNSPRVIFSTFTPNFSFVSQFRFITFVKECEVRRCGVGGDRKSTHYRNSFLFFLYMLCIYAFFTLHFMISFFNL